MYDYVRRSYSVDPQVGDRVRHTELKYPGNIGTIAPEDPGQGHYVQVKLDGHDHASPCHPTALEYLGPRQQPSEPGGYIGDKFYGDPAQSTVATHEWTGVQWIAPSKAVDIGQTPKVRPHDSGKGPLDLTRLVEEVPGVPDEEAYFIWHGGKTVWKGPTRAAGEAWATENGIVIDEFEGFEP